MSLKVYSFEMSEYNLVITHKDNRKHLLFHVSQMTEGRRCQVHLLDDRKLELLVQVSACSPVVSHVSTHPVILQHKIDAVLDVWLDYC